MKVSRGLPAGEGQNKGLVLELVFLATSTPFLPGQCKPHPWPDLYPYPYLPSVFLSLSAHAHT